MVKYIRPQMDVKEFVKENILTASTGGSTCSVNSVVTPGLCSTEGLCFMANSSSCGSDCSDGCME